MSNARTLVFFLAFVFTACSGASGPSRSLPPLAQHPAVSGTSPIQHVIIIVQENRSFDNLFAQFPGADGATKGKNWNGQTVRLTAHPLDSHLVLNNGHQAWVVDYDSGKMDGFGLVYVNGHRCTCAYQYVEESTIQPYWSMAQQYVLADHMFQTQSSGSFTAHQDLIRGDTAIDDHESLIDFPNNVPWGCDAPAGTVTSLITDTGQYLQDQGPFPCLSYETLRDLLDAKGVSWKYYTPSLTRGGLGGLYWNAFDAIHDVRYGPEWGKNVSSPEKNVLTDIANGKLPAVSWVVPDAKNSDHPGLVSGDTGPSWVAQIVNALGSSAYWNSSAVVITWDDWGGWYDHVPPPQLDYNGLGFRVPMIVVSPYAKTGYVSHTQYEFGSILKFVEDTFDLGRLGTTDGRANSISDVFNFNRNPHPFVRVNAKYSKSFFLRQAPSNEPVDTN